MPGGEYQVNIFTLIIQEKIMKQIWFSEAKGSTLNQEKKSNHNIIEGYSKSIRQGTWMILTTGSGR